MKTSLPAPTAAEQSRIDIIRGGGCCVCRSLGKPNSHDLELHHILLGGRRMSHFHTMFLCRGHHQGQWSRRQLDQLETRHRVSIAHGRKTFCKVFGTERELWEQLQARYGFDTAWPTTKILPRRKVKVVESLVQEPVQLSGDSDDGRYRDEGKTTF